MELTDTVETVTAGAKVKPSITPPASAAEIDRLPSSRHDDSIVEMRGPVSKWVQTSTSQAMNWTEVFVRTSLKEKTHRAVVSLAGWLAG